MPRKLPWAKIKQGPRAGESVPSLDVNPSINLISEPQSPRNPYASGYGDRIPTRHKVRVFDQRFRRVYVAQWANAGSPFIEYKGERFLVSW